MGDQTAEERQGEYVTKLGAELGPVYYALHNEVTWLHAKWQEYQKLFGESEARIDLLNEVAGFAFRVIQDVLWEDILLHIARLAERPTIGRFQNLTLTRLVDAVADDAALSAKMKPLRSTAIDQVKPIRVWRDKHLAHRELGLAVSKTGPALPGISPNDIKHILSTFAELLNCFHDGRVSPGVHIDFNLFVAGHGDGNALAHHLGVAARLHRRHRERIGRGEWIPEDQELLMGRPSPKRP